MVASPAGSALPATAVAGALRDGQGLGQVGLGQEGRELVAAEPPGAVARAQAAAQRRRDGRERTVARLMPVGVVDGAEVVQVHQHQGQRATASPGAGDLLIEAGMEGAVVEQPGERVGAGQHLQARVGRREGLVAFLDLAVELARFQQGDDLAQHHHRAKHAGPNPDARSNEVASRRRPVETTNAPTAGSPADEAPRVTEQSYRASTAQGVAGSGLVLYGTKAVVEQHGGTISVESAMGDGTTDTLTLPLAP